MVVFSNLQRSVLICAILLVMFDLPGLASPSPRLFNAEFDLCEIGGVACEWVFEGSGEPVILDGRQGITQVPRGDTAYIWQNVAFCMPNSTYQASVFIPNPPDIGCQLWLGIDPTGGQDPSKTEWSATESAGLLSVTAVSKGWTCSVLIALVNPTDHMGSAFVERVEFVTLASTYATAQAPMDGHTPAILLAREKLEEGRTLMSRARFGDAYQKFAEIAHELPHARSEAAAALVGMQEARKAFEYQSSSVPWEELPDFFEIDNLRIVREWYAEERESCALATCKLGEFYLSRQVLPMAAQILGAAVEDFGDTPGAMWARTHLVNERLWSGDIATAAELANYIADAYREGKASVEQFGWSQYFYTSQRIGADGAPDTLEQQLAYHMSLWDEYLESFPNLACKGKENAARVYVKTGEIYKAVELYREIIDTFGLTNAYSERAHLQLAGILMRHGWRPEHKAEALELCDKVSLSPAVREERRILARETAHSYAAGYMGSWRRPESGRNLLRNPLLSDLPAVEASSEYVRVGWRKLRARTGTPNWPLCDWERTAPFEVPPNGMVAWNSENCGEPVPMEGGLVSDPCVADASLPFEAGIWFAAEGWDGGDCADAYVSLNLRFLDGFQRPVGEFVMEPVRIETADQEWVRVSQRGITPADACYAELSAHFVTSGVGHHAVAVANASFQLEGDND